MTRKRFILPSLFLLLMPLAYFSGGLVPSDTGISSSAGQAAGKRAGFLAGEQEGLSTGEKVGYRRARQRTYDRVYLAKVQQIVPEEETWPQR